MRKLISIFAAVLIWLPASAQELHPLTPHPEGVPWPTEIWARGTMPDEAAADVYRLIGDAMAREKSGPMGETRAIVIIHKGELIAEAYRDGFTGNTKHMSWSIAKSFTNALVGRAVQLGLIEDIDDPMPTPFPEGDPRGEISWRHWLNMTEGLSNHELSEGPIHKNYIADMMFGAGKYDVAQFAVDNLEVEDTPGEVWKYSTSGYHMIGWALGKEFGADGELDLGESADFSDFKEKHLNKYKNKLERTSASDADKQLALSNYERILARLRTYTIAERRSFQTSTTISAALFDVVGWGVQPEFDAAGTYLGGSNVWASAHDYAKFGYLYLRDGVWEGERLLPEGWVDFSRTRTTGENINTYGAGFWVTTRGEEPMRAQALQSPPWDTFNANGSEGQMISIVPSRDLVIVRLGQMANNTENWNMLFEWSQEIARAFPEVELEETALDAEAPAELVAAE